MTPQERQLVDDLFERLARLEDQPRDRDAERAIAEGLAHAPHAIYPLVQTVLVQDEALRMAEDRIRDLGGEIEEPQQERGFLDSIRDTLMGSEPPRRGSVPSVRDGVWNTQQRQPAYQPPMQQQDYASNRGGGSFLGTAAAAAAGMIGGSLLMNSLGSMMGGDKAHAGTQKFGETGGGDSPWGGARDSDLAREAGLNDIGGGQQDRQGLFDSPQRFSDDPGGDGGFDGGGGDGGGGGD